MSKEELELQKKLEEKLEEKMDKVFSDDDAVDDGDVTETDEEIIQADDIKEELDSTPDDVQAEKDTTDDSTPDDEAEVEAEVEVEEVEKAEEVEAKGDEPLTLPDSYIRAAIHQGWTQQQVDEFFGNDPKLAKRTFENIYTSTNKISEQFAELGRKSVETKPADREVTDKRTSKVQQLDVGKLEEEYGSGDPLVAALKNVQAQNEAMQKEFEELKSSQTSPETGRQVDSAIMVQVDGFFNDSSMKSLYNDFYGDMSKNDDWKNLTPGQQANRAAVLKKADEMMLGAEANGMDMEVKDALLQAHLLVTDSIREKITREKILKQVKKRSKSISISPTGKKGIVANSGERTEAEIERSVGAKMAKVFSK